jgi:hypothetical protein
VILAGASLGAVLDSEPYIKPHWRETFFHHLEILLNPPPPDPPPPITQVYILDHRDCRAYRIFRGLPGNPDPDDERRAHEREMYKLRDAIQQRHSGLPVFVGLLERREGKEEFTVLEIE